MMFIIKWRDFKENGEIILLKKKQKSNHQHLSFHTVGCEKLMGFTGFESSDTKLDLNVYNISTTLYLLLHFFLFYFHFLFRFNILFYMVTIPPCCNIAWIQFGVYTIQWVIPPQIYSARHIVRILFFYYYRYC